MPVWLQTAIMTFIPLAAYFFFVVRPNLKKAKALKEIDLPPREDIKDYASISHSLSEAPEYLRITNSTFMSIDMRVEVNKELFKMLTLFYKALAKENGAWRSNYNVGYSKGFHLNDHYSHIMDNLIPALEIIQKDFINLQTNDIKLLELNDALEHEIELMKVVSKQLGYGVPATNETILDATSKIVLGIVREEKELNMNSLSELEQELELYDELVQKNRQKEQEALDTYDRIYEELRNDLESSKQPIEEPFKQPIKEEQK
ncbi:MAG: hypothetical protein ABS904_00795 [Solibacillus isronensis]